MRLDEALLPGRVPSSSIALTRLANSRGLRDTRMCCSLYTCFCVRMLAEIAEERAHVEERGPVHASVKEKRVCDRTIGA
jgi:hypothetical protein